MNKKTHNMVVNLLGLLLILCVFFMANCANAGPNAIQFVNQSSFSFGEYNRPTSGSNCISMTTSGVVTNNATCTGNGSVTTGDSYPGSFKIKGFPGALVNIIAGTGAACTTTSATITSPGTIIINNFKNSVTNNTASTSVAIGSDGYLSFNVAADTSTTNNTASRINTTDALGIYSANYCVSANYISPAPSGETTTAVLSSTWQASLQLGSVTSPSIGAFNVKTLDFGKVAVPTTAGTIRLSAPSNTISNITGVSEFSGTTQLGSFKIFGANNASVATVSIASGTLTGPGTALTINNFNGFTTPVTLSSTGYATINYGADLSFGANQTSGTYYGSYVVTVNY